MWKYINAQSNRKTLGLILGPLSFFLIFFLLKPKDLSQEALAILASSAWIAIWWVSEAMPIAVTSLLPIILFPLSGGMELPLTTAAFGHKYIFLYIGGFILAIAIERWNLHKRIALNIIRIIGTDTSSIILGFMLATAFLSMWISNTATAIMMLPIAAAVIKQRKDDPHTEVNETEQFGKALMISIAYSSSIGGVATLIGTAPNLVLAGILQELYAIEISFTQWIVIGLPVSMILLFISWIYLTRIAYRFTAPAFPGGQQAIQQQLKELGAVSKEEKLVLMVFALTALAWISRSLLLQKIIPALDDTIIAIIAAFLLFLLPSKNSKTGKLINWEEAVKLPWGILLLFGGGLAIAQGFKTSGLAAWIGAQLGALQGIHALLIVLILVLAINFLTEITSNLATTSMMLPVLGALALAIDMHPFIIMTACTIAASCAFMLPVATPPNAVVFGSGYLRIPDMMRTGIAMNLISVLIISLFIYYLLPDFWTLADRSFPQNLK